MADEVRHFRASTQGLRGQSEFDAFIEHFGRTVLKVEIAPVGGAPLSYEMSIRATADFAVADGRIPPSRNTHVPALAEDDDLVLVAVRKGNGQLHHRGRDLDVGPGGVMLTRNGEAAVFTMPSPCVVSNLRLKRALLQERGVRSDAMAIRSIAQQPSLALLFTYAHRIADAELALGPALSRMASSHVHDLAAMLLTDGRPPPSAVGAARTLAVKLDIRRNFALQDLSVGSVARRQGISTSYLRRLMAESGTSFGQYLLEERLAMAHHVLTGAKGAETPISAVAYDCGFGDLSYFNRTFRRRYGMTPSEAREAGLKRS